jgi:putative oxidoreductase
LSRVEESAAGRPGGLAEFLLGLSQIVQRIAIASLTQFVLRIALAIPFWRSGVNKWDGLFQLKETTVYLFQSEFKLHLPGGPYDYPAPVVAAFLSGCAEIALPILLVLGLGTRFAAFGLLVMTAVIQLTVPSGWPIHITWAAMALALMAWGPGKLSVDRLLRSNFT